MNVEKPHTKDVIEHFWGSIWGIEKDYNEDAEWFKRQEKRYEELEEQVCEEIMVKDLEKAIGQSSQFLLERFRFHPQK